MIKFEDFFKVPFPNETKVKFNMNADGIPAWDLLREADGSLEYQKWLDMNAWKSAKGQANNNLNNANYLLAFAQYNLYGSEYYIFGGLYKVEQISKVVFPAGASGAVGYKLTLLDDFKEYRRRLIVKLAKPISWGIYNKPFNSVQKDFDLEIYEISPSTKLEDFNGFNNVLLKHSQLQHIYSKNAPEWERQLSSVKAVYCITDKSNGQLYVGSAVGEGGLWQRWQEYANVKNLTGGNKAFEDIKNEDKNHIIDNFTYSILEIFDVRTDKHVILERESFWKNVFKSREFGMNKN